ncbi:hypothetical protein GW17_00060671, partial [Ensete ventricosum]
EFREWILIDLELTISCLEALESNLVPELIGNLAGVLKAIVEPLELFNWTIAGIKAQPDNPIVVANNRQDSRTIAELAIPAILSVGVYSSDPSNVQLHQDYLPLYYPFLAMIGLRVGLSLYISFMLWPSPGG